MKKPVVVCTSTSGLDLWPDFHDIRLLRLHVHIGTQDCLDGSDLQAEEFHRWMLKNPRAMAVTSPPTPKEIVTFFRQLVMEGYTQALVLTLSSRISKTYEVVQSVAPLFKGRLDIWVFDTQIAAYGEANLALYAEQMLKRGRSIPGVISHLQLLRSQSYLFMTLGRLDYLIRSGRLSVTAGFIANLAQVRPVLRMSDGQIRPYEKVRTLERALQTMITSVQKCAGNAPYKLHVICGGVESTNNLLVSMLREKNLLAGVQRSPLTPVIAAHTGPDGAGLLLYRPHSLSRDPSQHRERASAFA